MIIKNPTIDELLINFPNLCDAVRILIEGLEQGKDPEYVLYLWDKARKNDWGVQLKK
jgi:hypothetical protein